MRRTLLPVLLMLASGPAVAQQSGGAELKQLELHDGSRGYAVVLDGEGHEHYCEARVTREAVDLGPCKPLRLVTPLSSAEPAPEPAVPTVSPAKAQVIALFERNGCTLGYADLRSVIEPLGARQRQVIGETISAMTESGEIEDDAARERAILRTGSRCSQMNDCLPRRCREGRPVRRPRITSVGDDYGDLT